MADDAVRSVCEGGLLNWPIPPPLCANILDAAAVSNDLEQQLRLLVTEHRRVRENPHYILLTQGQHNSFYDNCRTRV